MYRIKFFTKLQQEIEQENPLIFILKIIFFSIIILILIFIYDINTVQGNKLREKEENEVNETLFYYQKWLEPLDSFRKIPEYEKFVLSEKMNGRLGNQMFRFATLYAIGQMTNRTPVYGYNDCQMINYDEELSVLFPNFHSRIYFLKEDFNDTYNYPFATDCCDLIDTNVLVSHNITNRVLVLTGISNFINVNYFDHLRSRILEILEFSREVNEKCSYIRDKILRGDNSSYKICVHTRVGDFIGKGESKIGEVSTAIERIIKNHKMENTTFSLLMFGADINFLKTIKVNESINKIYYILEANMTRGEEFSFSSQSCDTFLSTASLSSYAFWMGYLMPQDRPIYYIPMITPVDTRQILPKRWIQLNNL